ncbi:DUF5317 family protein [Proteiniclasticum sp. C24MP]|uniref:DUF5317 family protein n=1 Tax=Proteiniclasticum sp. C24MP TaxID=3374101 RepID=UPI003754AE1C
MFIYILLAALAARIKGYSIKPVLKDYSLYPLFLAEAVYIFLQISVFSGNYKFIPYAGVFKTFYLYTLIIPIVVHKLYKTGIYGSIILTLGSLMNKFVMSQNGGKMPVYATLSKHTGYFDEMVLGTADQIHVLGNEATKYKILTDYIDVGYSILSIGDVLIHSFIFITIYSVIKSANINRQQGESIRGKHTDSFN